MILYVKKFKAAVNGMDMNSESGRPSVEEFSVLFIFLERRFTMEGSDFKSDFKLDDAGLQPRARTSGALPQECVFTCASFCAAYCDDDPFVSVSGWEIGIFVPG